MKHQSSLPFNAPVDVEGLRIFDYPQVIKHPMDLGTIRERLDSGFYNDSPLGCLHDITLVWDNCFHYNAPLSDVNKMGHTLQKLFINQLESNPALFNEAHLNVAKSTNPYKYFGKSQMTVNGNGMKKEKERKRKEEMESENIFIVLFYLYRKMKK